MKNNQRRALLASRGLRAARKARERLQLYFDNELVQPKTPEELESDLVGTNAMQGAAVNVALEAIEELELQQAALQATVANMAVYIAHLWAYTLAEPPEGVKPLDPAEEFITMAQDARSIYEQTKKELQDD